MPKIDESSLAVLSRTSFWYINDFVFTANSRPITYEDIPEFTGVSSEDAFTNFETQQEPGSGSLWNTLLSQHKQELAICIFISILQIILTFAPSFILNALIKFLMSDPGEINVGIYLAIFLFTTLVLQSIVSQNFIKYMFDIGLKIEGILQQILYRHYLASKSAQQSYKIGELMNMITFDTKRIGKLVSKVYMAWTTPITMFVAFYLLYFYTGTSVLIGAVSMVFLFPITIVCSTIYSGYVKEFYKIRDIRRKFMNDMISSMKFIKYYSVESHYKKKVEKIREKEFDWMQSAVFLDMFQSTVQSMIVLSGVVLTVVFYVYRGGVLSLAEMFTTISFFNILERPVLSLGEIIFDVMNSMISAKRITDFLHHDVNKELSTIVAPPQDNDTALRATNVKIELSNNLILKDVNFEIKKGEICAFTGENGCGKSVLMESICKIIQPVFGKMEVYGSVAYCAQTPWLLNKSIKQNILFGLPFDKEKYEQVLACCQLEKDLGQMNDGDLTLVGNNGSNLSGGQRHRLSLARACYANKDVYVIDSTFSALDMMVQKEIFARCFKEYLKGKTIILVTPVSEFVNSCDRVFNVYNKTVIEVSPSDLDTKETSMSAPEDVPPPSIALGTESENINTDSIDVSISDHLEYFREYESGIFWAILLVILFALSKILLGAWVSIWASDRFHWSLGVYATFFIFIAFLQVLLVPLYKYSFIFGGMRAAKNLHNKLFDSVLFSPLKFFEKRNIGTILNRFTEDQSNLDYQAPYFFSIFVNFTGHLFITMAMVVIVTPASLFLIIIIGALFLVTSWIVKKPQLLVNNFAEVSKDVVVGHFGATVNGVKTIEAFHSQNVFIKENGYSIDYHQRSRIMENLLSRWLSFRMEFLAALFVLVASIFTIYFMDTVNVALAAFAITYSLSISDQFNNAMKMFFYAEAGMVSFKRVHEYCQLEQEEKQHVDVKHSWPREGVVQLVNATLKYDDNVALNDLSAIFGPKEIIGIVGRTGSGKSSLFASIFRLVELSKGSIFIDGCDISAMNLKQVRRAISVIPQEPMLLTGSIRFNLDSHREYSDFKIWSVLEELHLKKKFEDQHISLDDPIDAISVFSVGEKQLLSVARAILSESLIVLLDEATSNIDDATSEVIQKIIKEKFHDKTVLIIAHKLKSIETLCNKILVLDQGRVVEFDETAKLIKDKNSKFAQMFY